MAHQQATLIGIAVNTPKKMPTVEALLEDKPPAKLPTAKEQMSFLRSFTEAARAKVRATQ